MNEERVKFSSVKDAARAWVVAAAHYSNLGGRPCKFTRSVGGACRAAGVSIDEMTDEYRRALKKPLTPYWAGWIAGIFFTDWTSGFENPGCVRNRLGNGYSKTEEYQEGWEDAQRAAAILRSLAPETEYDGPSVSEVEEQLKKAGY
jgi:hypothetical protein